MSHLRRATGESTIGHLGTLDPLATGVLPLLLGKYTGWRNCLAPCPKPTPGQSALGLPPTPTTPTNPGNLVGCPFAVKHTDPVRSGSLSRTSRTDAAALSAKKVEGKPAYKAARRGETVVLKSVSLLIDEFVIGEIKDGCAEFTIRISSGGCALRGA